MVPLVLGVSVVVFALIQAAPGGPEAALLSSGRLVDPSVVEAYRQKLGIDRPVPVQYARWAAAAISGDLGVSYSTTRPVVSMIGERLPATLELMAAAFVIAACFALIIGLAGALRPHTWVDRLATGSAFVGIAMPVFWLGLLLQMVLAVELGWLPVSGTHTVGVSSVVDHLRHLILPALVLASRYVASWSRYFRGSLLSVLASDYIRTARAQGLSEWRVIGLHAVRNALIPLVSVMALGLSPMAILLGMMLLLIFLGIFVDQVSMMLITLPVFMPMVQRLDIDLIWFGVLYLICMQLGLLLPPHGLLLMTMKSVAPPQVTMMHIFRAVVPYIVMSLLLLALIVGVPEIATWLPNRLG